MLLKKMAKQVECFVFDFHDDSPAVCASL
jgi:hypothetical protein